MKYAILETNHQAIQENSTDIRDQYKYQKIMQS